MSASPILIGGCLLVPLSLLVLATGSDTVRYGGCGFTLIAAIYGAYWLRGTAAALIVAGAGTSALFWAAGEVRYDLVSLFAAIGGGVLLTMFLGQRKLLFLSLLALVDCAVVTLGLTSQVVAPAAFSDSFPLASTPPVFSGIAVNGFFVGGIDLACAVIVADLLRTRAPGRRRYLLVLLYLALSLASALLAQHFQQAVPATVPPCLVALLATGLARRSSVPAS